MADLSSALPDAVEVLDTHDAILVAMAKGLLEDAGIPYALLGRIATLVNEVDPFVKKRVRIQVPRNCETEAREVLALLLSPAPVLEPDEI
jgi:hypothetical protein